MRLGSKKTLIFAMVAMLLAVLSLGGCSSSNQPKAGGESQAGSGAKAGGDAKPAKVYNLKVADMSPPTSVTAQAFEWWGKEIEKRTNGQVKFQYFWSGSLVGAYEQLNSVKAGNIDVTPYYAAYHPDLAPLPVIALLPMLSTELTAVKAADELYRTHPALEKEFTGNNVKYMFPANTFYGFNISRKQIKSIADYKGITFRAFGPFLGLYKELGSNVVSLPMPEVHDALDKGAIDGTFNYLSNMSGNRDWEVAKYLNTTNMGHNLGMPAVMSLKTWNSLPPDVQKVIEEVNVETVDQIIKIGQEFYDKDIKAFKDNGATLTEFPAEDVATLKKVAEEKVWKPFVADLEKKGIPATDVLNTYVKLLEKHSK